MNKALVTNRNTQKQFEIVNTHNLYNVEIPPVIVLDVPPTIK